MYYAAALVADSCDQIKAHCNGPTDSFVVPPSSVSPPECLCNYYHHAKGKGAGGSYAAVGRMVGGGDTVSGKLGVAIPFLQLSRRPLGDTLERQQYSPQYRVPLRRL